MYMVIPYGTAKFISTNIFAMASWDPTAKFNSCQYFRLYGMLLHIPPPLIHMPHSNGDQYDGDWVMGKRHGHGLLRTAQGTIYDVSWESCIAQ